MKQSVQFAFEKTKRGKAGKPPVVQHLIRSENRIRGRHPMALAGESKKQESLAVPILRTELVRPPLALDDGQPNMIEVTLVRIEAGGGLDEDDLVAGFKHLRDVVARWIGLDDRDKRIHFTCLQQRCRALASGQRYHGVRVEIASLDRPGVERHRVKGAAPSLLGNPAPQNPDAPPKKMIKPSALAALRAQTHLLARPAFVAYPWEQVEGEGLAGDEYKPASNVPNPPEVIHVPIPEGWTPKTLRGITAGDGKPATLALHRHPFRDRELGDVWLYRFGAPRG